MAAMTSNANHQLCLKQNIIKFATADFVVVLVLVAVVKSKIPYSQGVCERQSYLRVTYRDIHSMYKRKCNKIQAYTVTRVTTVNFLEKIKSVLIITNDRSLHMLFKVYSKTH